MVVVRSRVWHVCARAQPGSVCKCGRLLASLRFPVVMLSLIARAVLARVALATVAPGQFGMQDLQAIAEGAVAAADAYVAAAKRAPTSAQVASDIARQDAEMLASLKGRLGLEEQQRETIDLTAGGRCPRCVRDYGSACPVSWASVGDGVCEASAGYSGTCPSYGSFFAFALQDKKDFEQRCSACWPCVGAGRVVSKVRGALRGDAGAGFLQTSNAAASDAVANVRLVEPGSRALNAAVALRNGVSDALAAVEERQQADEAMYANMVASSNALARDARAVIG